VVEYRKRRDRDLEILARGRRFLTYGIVMINDEFRA
jgi:hypothetical protein